MNKKILIITAKGALAALVAVLLLNTKLTYEFKKNRKPFYKEKKCLKTKTETIWEYHWGYNEYARKWHYHYGPNRKVECVEYVVDSVEIK